MNPRDEPPRKVLMTADAVGGIWTFSLELARALTAKGIGVVLAVMGPPPSLVDRREAGDVEGIELHEQPFRLEWMDDPWEDLDRAAEWLLQLESRTGVDLVHLNGFSLAARKWQAPVVVVGHSCVLSWWNATRGVEVPSTWERYRRSVAAGLRAASALAAPSRAMLESLRRHYPLPRLRRVVRNGLEPSGFFRGPKECLVLGVGRLWDEAKNLPALDAAAETIPWPTVLAGDTSSPDGKEARLRHARGLGRLGRAELRALYGRASIFAHPARYEPFGLAPLEAALSGCALVLGDIPSLREVWADAAMYVPPDDSGALGHAIRRLALDPAKRDSLARRAIARASRYGASAMAAGYLDLYERALRSGSSRGGENRCAS
jgi:glycosyltransferase involved in cell wall biosynthesis